MTNGQEKSNDNGTTNDLARAAGPRPVWPARVAAALALTVGVVTCAQLEKEKLPIVTAAGPHSVLVGATVQLKATTANATDGAYAWKSETPAVATVDATGKVTGVAPGEARITATGDKSAAVGGHAVVVLEAPADLKASIPNYEKWLGSGHADATAVAFTNWRKDGAVPADCARCHSGVGFQDYVGGDGTLAGKVDRPAAESVITCRACHNQGAERLTAVTFPSGVTIKDLGPEARCMTCHQGRASGKTVDTAITNAKVPDDDTVSPMLRFTNVHYYPAAATLYAGRAGGGYQYKDKVYDARFRHVPGFDTCTGCHDPHATRPRLDACTACHPGAKDLAGAKTIRMISSVGRDYDGDGNVEEGVAHELDGLREKLHAAIVAYGKARQAPLCFGKGYPYWFKDTNGDGTCSAEEGVSMNGYASWTARLMKATYNYQLATKDPGAFAHNAKYIIELLYDSITDLNGALSTKIDMTRAVRGDDGHFDGASPAARRWDTTEKVEATCSRCHGGSTGYRFYVQHGASIEVPDTSNGLGCATCHTSFGDKYEVLEVKQTTFPGGVVAQLPGRDNLCGTCHAGREARATIDALIEQKQVRFVNVHYLPAAAVRQGKAARVGYEYDGKTYAGPPTHEGGVQCTSCHDPKTTKHTFRIADAWSTHCQRCHADANGKPEAIRVTWKADYDGDDNRTEGLPDELAGLAGKLLAGMRAAAPGLCYAAGVYPYFFKNDPMTGKDLCTVAEATTAARFAAWTPALMKAAHNYQLFRVEPGAYAHNFAYVAQLLIDSLEDVRGPAAVMGLQRP
jgi:predicted CXXCH cytochrome family protein